jgi:hypothetical protein
MHGRRQSPERYDDGDTFGSWFGRPAFVVDCRSLSVAGVTNHSLGGSIAECLHFDESDASGSNCMCVESKKEQRVRRPPDTSGKRPPRHLSLLAYIQTSGIAVLLDDQLGLRPSDYLHLHDIRNSDQLLSVLFHSSRHLALQPSCALTACCTVFERASYSDWRSDLRSGTLSIRVKARACDQR